MKKSKRYRNALGLVEQDKVFSLDESVGVLLRMPKTKFDETVELSCTLNADPKKSDQMIRGSVVLPHGTGRNIKVLVFCEPEKEEEAKASGADFVGSQDFADKISKENWLDFDSCISTPSMMKIVSRLGRILGPRGLMPSPKTGTVTENITKAIHDAKAGKVEFRMDKFGCLAVAVGKISFSQEALVENITVLLRALTAAKPQTVKGELIKSMYISSTMSPSLKVRF